MQNSEYLISEIFIYYRLRDIDVDIDLLQNAKYLFNFQYIIIPSVTNSFTYCCHTIILVNSKQLYNDVLNNVMYRLI